MPPDVYVRGTSLWALDLRVVVVLIMVVVVVVVVGLGMMACGCGCGLWPWSLCRWETVMVERQDLDGTEQVVKSVLVGAEEAREEYEALLKARSALVVGGVIST
jgi:hypothetical protein